MARCLTPGRPRAHTATRGIVLLVHLVAHLSVCLADVAIPYTELGPTPVSVDGMDALRTLYNRSYTPYNASYPTLRIGLSLSQLDDGWTHFLAMLVDVTNFRGGVQLNGVQHNVAVTYSVDDGSAQLARLIYSDMFDSGNYSAFLAPQTDTLLQSLLPLLPASNATVVSTFTSDLADYSSGYRNLFGVLPPDNLLFSFSLTAVNEAAQQYVRRGGVGSVNGIRTLCMFTVNESLPQARAMGVRDWIATENARRQYQDNITVIVDAIWSRDACDFDNYTGALSACPDNVDLMMLSPSDSDGMDAALALRASQLRPKAVLGLIAGRIVNMDDVMQVATAAGWVLPVAVLVAGTASIYELGGVFTDISDVARANAVWRAGAGLASAAQNLFSYAYAVSFTVLTAALTQTRSLRPADMRDAVLSLNGLTTVLTALQFDNTTGYNTQLNTLVVTQALSTGQYVTVNSSGLQYPYNCQRTALPAHTCTADGNGARWCCLLMPVSSVRCLCVLIGPWRLPADGDLLDVHQSVNEVLIAVVISVLGGWVALIITEQSIYLKKQGSRQWSLWLFLVALAWGGVAVWCAQVMTSTALQTSLPGSRDVLPMSYSFDIAIIALIPSVLLTYAGLMVLMGDVRGAGHRSSSLGSHQPLVNAGDARHARSAEFELMSRKAAEKRAASLSTRLHIQHLRRSMTWRVAVGSAIITAAMYQSRAVIFSMWVQPAEWEFLWFYWFVVWMPDLFFTCLSCLLAVHALRTRYIGAFLFAATVMGDWFIAFSGTTFHYLTASQQLSPLLLTANVSYEAISLVSGIIAAVICFIFVGLQFSRMQLSRNGLSLLVATIQANVARLQDRLQASEDSSGQLKLQLVFMARAAAYVAINTPIHTDYAHCMAQATTLESFQAMRQLLTSSLLRQPTSAFVGRMKRTMSASLDSSNSPSSVAQPGVAGEAGGIDKPLLGMPSISTKSAAVAPMPAPKIGLHRSATSGDCSERTSQEGAVELSRSVVPADLSAPFISVVHAAAVGTGSMLSTSERKRRSSVSGTVSSSSGELDSKAQARSSRSYEEQLAALLDRCNQHDPADTPPATSGPDGNNKAASLNMQASAAHSGGLAALLVHPACIAVIKSELQAIHSVENLIFYLHVQRYRQLQSAKLRRQVATAMYDTFINRGAEQQININARQRDSISACIAKRSDDSCGSGLFDEAQREVLQLMETNLLGSKAERVCARLIAQMPLAALLGLQTDDEDTE